MIATRTFIRLEAGCDHASCATFANDRYHQLNVPKYSDGVSILEAPATTAEWRAEHRTARKRADRAASRGYGFAEIDRSRYSDDINEINCSLTRRQGRPMSEGYLQHRRHGPLPDYPCERHRIRTFGVLQDQTLRAYLTLYRVGELALVSMILGHGEHLGNEIMYLLFEGTLQAEIDQGGFWFYNRWDSGEDGLRFFKSRLGFRESDVEWSLA